MKWFKRILVIAAVAIIAALYINYPKLTLISGYSAKYMGSSVFIANHKQKYIEENDSFIPNIKFASNVINDTVKTVSASVFGFQKREAIFKKGLGVILLPIGVKEADLGPFLVPNRLSTPTEKPYPQGDKAPIDTLMSGVNYAQIEKSLDLVFSDPMVQKTRTALILYKGQLLGERYIDGFSSETPILGWSMTKSIIATLYGILEYRGVLKVSDPVKLTHWKGDKRASITINDLLRMQSGLAFEENYDDISDVTKMLFNASDMGQIAIDRPSIAVPGVLWSYSSGTTNILSKYLNAFSEDKQAYLNFPYVSLIDKIGMHSMILETDMTQNFVGSSYGWASTRDWAKFGQLYLNEGIWEGDRLFDHQWIQYITTPTKASEGEYGAHFWLNASGLLKDVPRDMYSANGHDGQHVYIIPSKDLVIVRTGLKENPNYRANDFIAAVIAAIDQSSF